MTLEDVFLQNVPYSVFIILKFNPKYAKYFSQQAIILMFLDVVQIIYGIFLQ